MARQRQDVGDAYGTARIHRVRAGQPRHPASHNPRQWNALKLLNEKGEFLNAAEGQAILDCAESGEFDFAPVDELGHITEHDFTDEHIQAVIDLKAVDEEAVRDAGFKVVLDPVNSVGAIIMPRLLERMGVECIMINGTPDGNFAHNPEPLPKNLSVLSETVIREHADLGISVDPDVDRLAFICENGEPFVEEYTLVSVAEYLFAKAKKLAEVQGVTLEEATAPYKPVAVSNLSSSRALRDVAEQHGGRYEAAAVGEVNVTTKMHETMALIGGEGNGGVIYPASHYGRDAMVGVGIFLSNLNILKRFFSPPLITANRIITGKIALFGQRIMAEPGRCPRVIEPGADPSHKGNDFSKAIFRLLR